MSGSSLLIWVIILSVGVLTLFFMGCFNPFVSKEDKMKVKESKKNTSILKERLRVDIKFHFSGFTYVIVAVTFTVATLVFFFIESFSKFRDALFGNGFWGSIGALFIVLIGSAILEVVLLLIPIMAEEKTISSITTQYDRNYDAMAVVVDCSKKQ